MADFIQKASDLPENAQPVHLSVMDFFAHGTYFWWQSSTKLQPWDDYRFHDASAGHPAASLEVVEMTVNLDCNAATAALNFP